MTDMLRKLMRRQVEERLEAFAELAQKPVPKKGWIRIIRETLGMSTYALADRLGCTRSNISALEQREKEGAITLNSMEEVARAMDCVLVYCLVPLESFDKILEKQARKIAQKRIKIINHSMALEKQDLNPKQLKQQEDDLVRELLNDNPKKLWEK